MSRATLTVTFPDGQVRYGLYNGTGDFAYHPLYPTSEDAWADASDSRHIGVSADPEQMTAAQPVHIKADYGRGIEWEGRAIPDYLIGPTDPFAD